MFMQTRPGDSEDFPPGSDIDESRIPQPYHLFITCHIMRGSRAGLTPAGKKVGHHGGRNHHTNHPVPPRHPIERKDILQSRISLGLAGDSCSHMPFPAVAPLPAGKRRHVHRPTRGEPVASGG